MSKESAALDMVYAARDERELNDAYAAWSNAYDRETAAMGYCLPFLVTAWVARHVEKKTGPILDAGCGTGLSGLCLKALGYSDVHGLDFSPEMLALARGRGAYDGLTQAALGEKLPWPDGQFAAFFSTGVFTQGHAPASSLDELVRITRPGGRAIFTVRDSVFEAGGFGKKIAELQAGGRWRALEESPPFRAFVVAEPDVLVQAFVCEIL